MNNDNFLARMQCLIDEYQQQQKEVRIEFSGVVLDVPAYWSKLDATKLENLLNDKSLVGYPFWVFLVEMAFPTYLWCLQVRGCGQLYHINYHLLKYQNESKGVSPSCNEINSLISDWSACLHDIISNQNKEGV